MKLAVLTVGVGGALGFISIFLPRNFQSFTWGVIAGLLVSLAIFLERWHRKGIEPADTLRQFVTALLLVGALAALTQFLSDYVGWTYGGIAVGFFAMIGVILSPLFAEPVKPTPPT